MRVRLSVVALVVAIAGVVGLSAWTGGAAAPRPKQFADNRPGAIPVDTELVLAVDVSYSMDPEEQQLQREGYIEALTSREFLQALRGGMHAKVALIYFEWAGGLSPGEPHHYFIQGPTFVIEYDNTQDNANHVHCVYRDFDNDFGDAILQHYKLYHHQHGGATTRP